MSTIELFFDLVFVFTVTQITNVVVADPDPLGITRARGGRGPRRRRR